MNAATRTYIYGIAVAVMPILVAYGLLTAEQAPLWLALAAAVLAAAPNVLAIRNITPDGPDENIGSNEGPSLVGEELVPRPPAGDDDEDAVDLPEGGLADVVDADD